MYPPSASKSAQQLLQALQEMHWQLTLAESCTGGLLAGLITSLPGASAVFEQGFVTYSNASKMQLLGVDAALIEAHGAVSAPVAAAMAEGARQAASAQLAIAITGIAGPGGGSAHKPVGLVYIACATASDTHAVEHFFAGDRHAVRLQACEEAVELALSQLAQSRE